MQEPGAADQHAGRDGTRRRPRVSGKWTVILVVLCLLGSALLLPAAMRATRVVEVTVVLIAWWLTWVLALTALLYRGHHLEDDHTVGRVRNWFGRVTADDLGGADSVGWALGGEGCLLLGALIVLLGLAWLIVELIIPAVAIAIYVVIYRMLSRIANDTHDCDGHLGRSLLWGSVWATAYTAPLVAMVWLVHWAYIS